ncbi:LacI family DNA-binding transcriptional regulator [Roseivivax sediminis]|uniref:Transcriptional regulator, LacI family n=1 Tax=Roseivivax sediminis TaxID=936889 RepID=A0A1I2D2C9_9RHOB|nr:LacI family DNA-binding transcriptional regulator [Roseivivax sediminis]SFE74671.1 transcriptional regulator, LacI family [Roseivivax sediminis]
MSRPTIHDVARVAGVSLSTVDRVLNGRVGVREGTQLRVAEAMRTLGYERNVAAANLSRRRQYRLRFFLPSGSNSFMRGLEDRVRERMAVAGRDSTVIEVTTVPPFDAPALAAELRGLCADAVDGVAIVATDATAIRVAVQDLRARGIAVVTLVSDLPSSERQHFVGIDNVQAGRTAASLLGRFCRWRPGRIALVAGSMLVRDHVERRLGFEQVLRAEFPDQAIGATIEGLDDQDIVEERLRTILAEDPGITGIYSFGAGNRGVARAVSGLSPDRRPAVVVHELTHYSRDALLDGVFDAVIHQDDAREVDVAIRTLRALADGESPDGAAERIGVEVFLRDNLP